jgi:hypothetical protein
MYCPVWSDMCTYSGTLDHGDYGGGGKLVGRLHKYEENVLLVVMEPAGAAMEGLVNQPKLLNWSVL